VVYPNRAGFGELQALGYTPADWGGAGYVGFYPLCSSTHNHTLTIN